jgi:prepilin-type processing-associated H-X9-DG protein
MHEQLQQLTLAWRMYADDNNDNITGADMGGSGADWVTGFMDFSSSPANWQVTNDIAQSPLWNYCGKSAGIWHCPADKSQVLNNLGQPVPRVRSYSMNCYMGGPNPNTVMTTTITGNWKVFTKLSSIPSPSKMFVLLNEDEDSINNGWFGLDMNGYPNNQSADKIFDFPAAYHDRACGFSFADGHSEIHRWLDGRTMPPVSDTTLVTSTSGTNSPNNPDVYWIQDHATVAQ